MDGGARRVRNESCRLESGSNATCRVISHRAEYSPWVGTRDRLLSLVIFESRPRGSSPLLK